MATHVEITPIHEGKRAHAHEIVRKLEAHLGMRAKPTDDGDRFEFEDDDLERNASNLSGGPVAARRRGGRHSYIL